MQETVNPQAQSLPTPVFGLTANTLKLIAIIAMLIDHISAVFLPQDWPVAIAMRFIGRITGPTMFYFVAEGYRHTRNANRYTLRLAVFAAISYIPFIYCFHGALPNESNFLRFNVIYTILIGLLCIRVRHEVENPLVKTVLIVCLFVLSVPGDWFYLAPLMMLTFDYFYGDFKKQAAGYLLVILGASSLLAYALNPFMQYVYIGEWNVTAWEGMISELGLFLPIILLRFYNGQKGGGGNAMKWGFYVFYPLHLLILGVVFYQLI